MTMTATTNGKPQRKPLADQIDRLDDILDGLADALNGAVADAAREGARLAVKEAIFEVLTNPELRGLMARPQTPAPPTAPNPVPAPVLAPSVWSSLKTRLAALRARAAQAVKPAIDKAAAQCRAAKPVVAAAKSVVALAWRFKRVALTGLGVGLLTTAASYLAPHPVSAALTGVGGTLSALAVQGGLWVRATAKKLHLL